MIQSLAIGGTSPAKRQMKDDEAVGELGMCESPKRKRIQVETKSEPVSTLSAKAWAFSIDAIITQTADHPTTSSETSDSEDWPQNEDELKSDPGIPVSTVNDTNEHQRKGLWSHQTPAPRAASSPTQTPTLTEPPVGRPVESRFVDVRRLWTRRDCDTPPLKTMPRKDSDPRAADSRCAFLGAANPLPPHNPPEGRTESLKGSPSLCRVSRGTGDLARVRCQLETRDLWTKFNELGTEMIITKSGRKQLRSLSLCVRRRMFPVVRISFTGLKSTTKYLVLMDIVPVDSKRYRYAYHRSSWLVAGKADPDVQQRCYVHPDAPFLGEQLSKQAVSFEKLKLTNNVMDKHGYIILNSMHKYQPRIHLIKRSAVEPFMATPPQSLSSIRSDEIKTFEFPETVFIAVTAYQNQLRAQDNTSFSSSPSPSSPSLVGLLHSPVTGVGSRPGHRADPSQLPGDPF
nr:unnamed protein product [Spirometra erinaceieuropaei]